MTETTPRTWQIRSLRLLAMMLLLGCMFTPRLANADEPATAKRTRTLGERIQENKQLADWCDQLSDRGHYALRGLIDQSMQLGRMLTLTEFIQHMEAPFFRLESDLESKLVRGLELTDYDILWLVFSQAQASADKKSQILSRLREAREAVRTLHVAYTVTEFDNGEKRESVQRCSFAMDRQRLYFDRSPDRQERVDRKIDAYDGQVLRELFEEGGKTRGVIQTLDSKMRFVSDSNPLVQSGIINSFEFPVPEMHDLARQARDMSVFDEQEAFEGEQCIVMGSPIHRYFLSPKLNFAMIGSDSRFEFDKKAGQLQVRQTYGVSHNSGFQDLGGGLWLPTKMEIAFYKAGRITHRRTTEVTKWQINAPLDASLFTDVIPAGTWVTDAVRNEFYREN